MASASTRGLACSKPLAWPGGIDNAGLALSLGAAIPSLSAIGAAALVGFLDVGVSLFLFVVALRHLGAARTGAHFSPAPFIGAVIAIPLLHDKLTPQLIGWRLPINAGHAASAPGL